MAVALPVRVAQEALGGFRAIHQVLLVPLDDGGRTHLGVIRILAELAPRLP